jgi:hypothetical protein
VGVDGQARLQGFPSLILLLLKVSTGMVVRIIRGLLLSVITQSSASWETRDGKGAISLQRRRPEQGMGVALARDGDLYM